MKKYLHEFITYSDGTTLDNGWWEIKGDKLYNGLGGFHDYTPSPNDEIVEAENYQELIKKIDFSYLLKPNSKYGWLAPDGRFYGCDPWGHMELATHYFHKADERELEEEGYLKIFRSPAPPFHSLVYIWDYENLTKEQATYLLKNNIKHNDAGFVQQRAEVLEND